MSEAVAPKLTGEVGPVQALIGLLGDGDAVGVTKLTLEMIDETAEWIELDLPNAELAGVKIRHWWLGEVRKEFEEDADEFGRRWDEAFTKAKAKEEPKPVVPKAVAELLAKRRAEPEPKAVVPAEPKAEPSEKERVRAPETAPGLLGEMADYAMGASMYPSKKFSIALANAVTGTLISRRIAGPSGPRGTGTHCYCAIIGPTGIGKEAQRTAGKVLLTAAGAADRIGPGRFKSSAGIIKFLLSHPASLCFMDELGGYFARLSDPKAGTYDKEQTDIFRELWGLSWGRYDSPQGATEDSQAVTWPALSIFGMSTPKELYMACKDRDVSNGYLNRWEFVEEKGALQFRNITEDALEISKGLQAGMTRLYSLIDQVVNPGPNAKPPFRMSWGPGAEDVYIALREQIERETDDRRRELLWRTPEKAVRAGTRAAAACFEKAVSREHMEWGRDWILAGDETLYAGVVEYMQEEKLGFPELCREIIRRMKRRGGAMTHRQIKRSFQNNLHGKKDLNSAMEQLLETGQIIEHKQETGGRPSYWYSLPGSNAVPEEDE